MASMRITADLGEALEGLDRLGTAAQEAIRPAAQAGAQVFYDEVKRRVPVHDVVRKYKRRTIKPGTLQRAIYQAFSRDQSSVANATAVYHISWSRRKAPHGHLVEFGHKMPYKVIRTADGRFFTDKSQPSDNPGQIVGRRPFLRPSYDAVRHIALQVARERLLEDVRALMPEVT